MTKSHKTRKRQAELGQASVEYLLVACVFVAMCCALGALWHAASEGRMARLAELNASHAVGQLGGALDVLLY